MTYKANVGELIGFVARFLPPNQAQVDFEQLYASRNQPLLLDAPITESDREFSEKLIASSVGNAHLDSVGKLVDAFVMHGALDIRDVMRIVDGARVFFEFMQELVQSSIQHISQGISVVDQNMRMVAWNKKYIEFFEYPDGYVTVGRPVADLIRFNIEKTGCHPSLVDSEVAKRVDYLRSGTPHNFERYRPGGKVLEVHGNPMPGAGFVTSYTDITPHKELESQLRRANETLELRVQARTHELEEAKLEAEQANFSKTQFLAAASHDLMQPLNAAGLFASALQQKVSDAGALELITNITLSLKASHDLLNSLLEASRLDSGAIRPKITVFPIDDLLSELDREFTVLAKEEGLAFRKATSHILVRSDRQLLRRILQNFLSNAVRYTQHGKILLGCRHIGNDCRIEVWDTGCGIPENKWREIFQEFRRLDNAPSVNPQEGLGLGLAIAERISHLLGHEISLRSWPDKGSVFSVSVPMASSSEQLFMLNEPVVTAAGSLDGLRVLCVENDYFVLEGMKALLGGWECDVSVARGLADALEAASQQMPDIVLADYQLDDGVNGIDVLNALREVCGRELLAIVITANNTEVMRNAAEAAGYLFMPKPVKPASLRAAISGLLNR